MRRSEGVRGLLLVLLGVAVWLGLFAVLWLSTVEALSGPEPVAPTMRVYTTSANDLYVIEYDNRINPQPALRE